MSAELFPGINLMMTGKSTHLAEALADALPLRDLASSLRRDKPKGITTNTSRKKCEPLDKRRLYLAAFAAQFKNDTLPFKTRHVVFSEYFDVHFVQHTGFVGFSFFFDPLGAFDS